MSSNPAPAENNLEQMTTLDYQAARKTDNPPHRAATSPDVFREKEILQAVSANRSRTLPAELPSLAAYLPSDTPLPTPGESLLKAQHSDYEGPPQVEATARRSVFMHLELSKARSWLGDAGQKTLGFIESHWIICSTLFILSIVATSFAVGFALRLGSFDAAQVLDENIAEASTSVILQANLISIDSDSQSMTLDWFIGYNCNPQNCPDVNIYFDQNLLRAQSLSSVANNAKPPPIFFLNGTDYITWNNSDFRTSSPEFRTQVAITNFYGGRSAQSYPFDKYSATLVFFAEALDNSTVAIGIDLTEGIAVGFNAALETSISGLASNGVLIKNLEVTRGQVIRMYAVLIVVAIWMVTLAFIMTCIVVIFFGKGIKPDILVVPVATLFAFTSLRGTMPGAPSGFGADIDFVGILPCLALLTFSSVLLSAIFLFRRDPEKNRPRWENIMRKMHGGKPMATTPSVHRQEFMAFKLPSSSV